MITGQLMDNLSDVILYGQSGQRWFIETKMFSFHVGALHQEMFIW